MLRLGEGGIATYGHARLGTAGHRACPAPKNNSQCFLLPLFRRALERVWRKRDKYFDHVFLYEDLLLDHAAVERGMLKVGFTQNEVR